MVGYAVRRITVVSGVAAGRSKYVSAQEAARMLDGLLAPKTLRTMAKSGLIAGAVRVPDRSGSGWRYFFDRRAISDLVVDLCARPERPAVDDEPAERPYVWHDRRGRTMLDSQHAV